MLQSSHAKQRKQDTTLVCSIAGHMYRTNFGIGHNMQEALNASTPLKAWGQMFAASNFTLGFPTLYHLGRSFSYCMCVRCRRRVPGDMH